jgi:hypothetical protein
MVMKKEWFAAKDLLGIAGLPSSPQGINLMARREGWESRRRKGVQGKALEYCIDSLPLEVRHSLSLSIKDDSASYEVERPTPLTTWIGYYEHMSEAERERVIRFLARGGINKLLAWIEIEEGGA